MEKTIDNITYVREKQEGYFDHIRKRYYFYCTNCVGKNNRLCQLLQNCLDDDRNEGFVWQPKGQIDWQI